MDARPIGVFDSGVGGLTVARALQRELPAEALVYLGDTARLPYGTKSPETIRRYARAAARQLVERDIKLLVVACNTASSVALEDLQRELAPLPVVGVVEPGAHAAVAACGGRPVLVLGTESTISGGAYVRAITSYDSGVEVRGRACPLFVALAEEGLVRGDIPRAVARRYLTADLLDGLGAIVLGCTHFPVLRETVAEIAGEVPIVDSAGTTAKRVRVALDRLGLAAAEGAARPARVQLLATDGTERFARVGGTFLGRSIERGEVEVVDLGPGCVSLR